MFDNNKLIISLSDLIRFTSVNSLSLYCFRGCSALIRLNADNFRNLTSMGIFYQCSNLEYISSTISGAAYFKSVININGTIIFSSTNKIKAIFLPQLVTQDGWAFRDKYFQLLDVGEKCTKLNVGYAKPSNLVCRAITPPTLANSFTSTSIGSIYVPEESVELYQATGYWASKFSSKIFAIGGSEWTAQFGSSDEWADYDMYWVEHEE